MSTHNVGYIIGSLSQKSINRTLSRALVQVAGDRMNFTEIEIDDLPVYNRDLDDDLPTSARQLKEEIESVDAVLFITPEYNRSIPGGLKNAIDWASRPWGTNSFANIPSGVIGTSPGSIGTAVGQQHLRSILGFLNAPQMNAPEAYIQFKDGMINDAGEIADASTADFLRNYLEEFHEFVARVLTVLPRGA